MAANDIADLLLKIDATTEGLRREIKNADDTVAGFSRNTDKKLTSVDRRFAQMGAAVKRTAGIMAGALAAAGLAKLTGDMVSVNAESQRLMASLQTVTGSIDGANRAWSMLEKFASTTPFQLEQSVNAFVKMKALGLNPTESALTSFGNTAAAMGKDLNQMIEAVADASTSEFERLKEFGIKARKQGDEVSLTFQGITTTIGNNAEEIVGYLEDIGNNQFAGAMERQMDTLNGAFSNLGDTTDRLIRQIGERGANEGLTGAINWLTDQVGGLADAVEGPTINSITQQIREIEAALEGTISGRNSDSRRAYLNNQLEDLRGQLDALKASDGDVSAINARLAVLNDELAGLEGTDAANPRAQRNLDRRITTLKNEIEELNAVLESSQPLETFESNLDAVSDQAEDTAQQVDVLDELMTDLGLNFTSSANRMGDSWADFLQDAEFQDLISGTEDLAVKTVEVADATEESAERVRTAWDAALQDTAARIDESFSQAWRGAFDSFDDFSRSLVDAFKNLLAEMAHLAITRPIIMNIGAAVGVGGAAAAGASAGFNLADAGSSLATAFTGLGAGAYNLLADGAYAVGLDTLGLNARASAGLGWAGQAMNLGAGFVGNLIGNELFGPTSGIGSTALGFVGSAFGPIGALAGSVLGSGIESLFGGGRPDHNVTGVRFASNNWANGNWRAGEARIFDSGSAETDAAAMEIAETLEQMRLLLGGSNQDIVYNVGDQGGLYLAPGRGEGAGSGPNFNGHTFQYGDDIEGFLNHAFDQMIAGATGLSEALRTLLLDFNGTTEQTMQMAAAVMQLDDQIKQNPVTVAIEDFAAAQESATSRLWDSYQQQLRAVRTLAINFDGSAASAVEMSEALRVSQEMAYRMSVALLDVSNQIDVMFQNSAEQIRESVMTEDQRIAKWRSERDTLQAGLENISDPEALLEAADEINRLNLQIFQSLEDASAETAEQFATFADETNRIAQERIETILGNLENSQASQMDLIGDTLQQAANQQQMAAQVIADAATVFRESAGDFQANWNSMSGSLNGMRQSLQQVANSTRKQAELLDDVIQGNKLQTETAA